MSFSNIPNIPNITSIKYCYYFHKLLWDIFAFIVSKKIYGRDNQYLLTSINSDIKNSGFVVIKLVQWILCRYKTLMKTTYANDKLYKFLANFSDVYENCNIHSFSYTKNVFCSDFFIDLEEVIEIDKTYSIKSASIAQVYRGTLITSGERVAIKVTHPELTAQFTWPYFYYCLYSFLIQNCRFLKKYTLPFDMTNFFDNFVKQTDMSREAKNLEYFYNNYQDNPLIIIPKPIVWSKNVLVMQYIDGVDFETLEDFKYSQYRVISIINLFVRNNMINLTKIHADLHNSNWKVIMNSDDIARDISDNRDPTTTNTTNTPRLVIYDFGFCIDTPERYRQIVKDMNKAIETNNHNLFIECMYNYLYSHSSREDFLRDSNRFIGDKNKPINVQNFIEFCVTNNYILKSDVLDLLLSTFLVNNYFRVYTSNNNIEEDFERDDLDYINKLESTNNQLMTLSSICDINNCFTQLNKYFKDFINENSKTIVNIKQQNMNRQQKLAQVAEMRTGENGFIDF